MRRFGLLLVILALLVAACNRGEEADETTTTTVGAQTTTTAAPATTAGGADDETTTTAAEPGAVPDWEIIYGDPGTGEYVVLVEPGNYTELDLQNVMEAVVDEYAPAAAHLVDTEDARDLVLNEETTPEEQEILAVHYYARIVEGTTLEFVGPYADFESVYIGS